MCVTLTLDRATTISVGNQQSVHSCMHDNINIFSQTNTYFTIVITYVRTYIMESIYDTSGQADLSTEERLSTLQRWKCISTVEKSISGAS